VEFYMCFIGQPVRRGTGKWTPRRSGISLGATHWTIECRRSRPLRKTAPRPKVSKAPLSVVGVSVKHKSYTISAKCSTREDKEWKVKESYATKTESYTVDDQAGANGVRYSSESKREKGGIVKRRGIYGIRKHDKGRVTIQHSVPREEAPLVAPNTAPSVARLLTIIAAVLAVVDRVLIVVATVLVVAAVLVVSTVLTIVSAILTVVTITTDGKVNRVIDRSTLGNWHENSLMVRSGSDGGHPVCTSRETLGDIGSELAVGSSSVETLEESKDTWVCGLR